MLGRRPLTAGPVRMLRRRAAYTALYFRCCNVRSSARTTMLSMAAVSYRLARGLYDWRAAAFSLPQSNRAVVRAHSPHLDVSNKSIFVQESVARSRSRPAIVRWVENADGLFSSGHGTETGQPCGGSGLINYSSVLKRCNVENGTSSSAIRPL